MNRNHNKYPIIKMANSTILYTEGEIDERCVEIEYYNKKNKIGYLVPTEELLYENIIRLYSKHENQKEWFQLVNELFDLDKLVLAGTNANPEFICAIKDIFEKHSWINSEYLDCAGSECWLGNKFSKYWTCEVDNFYATMIIARLFGDAKDYMDENYRKHGKSTPLSAILGRLGTKYCIYKIIDGEYPDFCDRYVKNADYKNWDIFNKCVLWENVIPREGQNKLYMVESQWAEKLSKWFKKDKIFDRTKKDAGSRIEESIRERMWDDLKKFKSNRNGEGLLEYF
jgi:hypothetical protein